MRSPEYALRTTVRCEFRCKHCRAIIGAENVAHYGRNLPPLIKPNWFFAAMSVLDHLRDCRETDFSEPLRERFGPDFLNHPEIWQWFNTHATIERKLLSEEELDEQGHLSS